jgi:hypothetical protein
VFPDGPSAEELRKPKRNKGHQKEGQKSVPKHSGTVLEKSDAQGVAEAAVLQHHERVLSAAHCARCDRQDVPDTGRTEMSMSTRGTKRPESLLVKK